MISNRRRGSVKGKVRKSDLRESPQAHQWFVGVRKRYGEKSFESFDQKRCEKKIDSQWGPTRCGLCNRAVLPNGEV